MHPSQVLARKTLGFLAAYTMAVLLVLLAGFSAWKWWYSSAPLSEKASIAVLPFENIGNDPKWDRFADGITEDIVTDLSHSKDLFVVARNSTEALQRQAGGCKRRWPRPRRPLRARRQHSTAWRPDNGRPPSSSIREQAATFGPIATIVPQQTCSMCRATSPRKLPQPSPDTRAPLLKLNAC